MRTFKDSQVKTFKQIAGLTQDGLRVAMAATLRKAGYKDVTMTEDYIVAQGTIPICLVAHMDTVFPKPPKEIFYDTRQNVMWSPQGLGADDRAGVFAILQIIKAGFKPHIIFTTDEEIGGQGANMLSYEDCPFKNIRYFIQLDRQGSNDCVFYDCDNPIFVEYIESFGFVESWGTFSDISILCPAWGIAGVNLSVGYRDEHTREEVLFVGQLLSTIDKVKKMLTANNNTKFEYIPASYDYGWGYYRERVPKHTKGDAHHCYNCGHWYMQEEMFPVKLLEGGTANFCPDCLVDHVGWCHSCNEPFELEDHNTGFPTSLCPDCRKEIFGGKYSGYSGKNDKGTPVFTGDSNSECRPSVH